MTQPTCRAFFQSPIAIGRPETRQLFSGKPGADAHRGVVARHAIAADGPKLAAELKGPSRTPRLHGDKYPRLPGYAAQKPGQPGVVKMMQEQIRNHGDVPSPRQ